MRLEQFERTRRAMIIKYMATPEGFRATLNFNPEKPWNYVFRAVTSGECPVLNAFWSREITEACFRFLALPSTGAAIDREEGWGKRKRDDPRASTLLCPEFIKGICHSPCKRGLNHPPCPQCGEDLAKRLCPALQQPAAEVWPVFPPAPYKGDKGKKGKGKKGSGKDKNDKGKKGKGKGKK